MAPAESAQHILLEIDSAVLRMRENVQDSPYTIGALSVLAKLQRGDAWRKGTWFQPDEGPQQYTTFVYHNPMHSDLILQTIKYEDPTRRGTTDSFSKDQTGSLVAKATSRPAKRKMDLKEYTKTKRAAGDQNSEALLNDTPRSSTTPIELDHATARSRVSPQDLSQQSTHAQNRRKESSARKKQFELDEPSEVQNETGTRGERRVATSHSTGSRRLNTSPLPDSNLPWISEPAGADVPDDLPPILGPLRTPTPTLSAPSPDALKRNAFAAVLDGRSSIHMRLSMPSEFKGSGTSEVSAEGQATLKHRRNGSMVRDSARPEQTQARADKSQRDRNQINGVVRLKYSQDNGVSVQKILGKIDGRSGDAPTPPTSALPKKRKLMDAAEAADLAESPKRVRTEALTKALPQMGQHTALAKDLNDTSRVTDGHHTRVKGAVNRDDKSGGSNGRDKGASSSHSSLVNVGKTLKRDAAAKLRSITNDIASDDATRTRRLGIVEKVESLACFVRGFSFLSEFKSQRSPTLYRSWETVIPFAAEVAKDCQKAGLGPPEAACMLMQAAACKQVLFIYSFPGVEDTLDTDARSKLKETLMDRARMLQATTDAVDALLTRDVIVRDYPNAHKATLKTPLANALQPQAVVGLAVMLLKDWTIHEGIKWQPHEELAKHL